MAKSIFSASSARRGASLTGYGLVVGLIAVLAIAAVQDVGDEVSGLFGVVDQELSDAGIGAASGSGSGAGSGASSGGSTGGGDPLTLDVAIPDQSWSVLAEWGYSVPSNTFSDAGATLTADLDNGSSLPTWLSFDGSAFTGTPPGSSAGTLDLRVTADNGSTTISDTFTLTINGFVLSGENSFTSADMDAFICDQTLTPDNNTRPGSSGDCYVYWPVPTANVTAVTITAEQNPGMAVSGCTGGRWDSSYMFQDNGSTFVSGDFAESYNNRGNFSYNGGYQGSSFKLCQSGLNSQFVNTGSQCSDTMTNGLVRKYKVVTYSAVDDELTASLADASAPGSPEWNIIVDESVVGASGTDLPVMDTDDHIVFYLGVQPSINECGNIGATSNNGEFQILGIDLTITP